MGTLWIRVLSPLVGLAFATGLQVSDYKNPVLGWYLMAASVIAAIVLWTPPLWRYVRRLRVVLKPDGPQQPSAPKPSSPPSSQIETTTRLTTNATLIPVDGVYKEVPEDAWNYYQEADAAGKGKIEKFIRDTRGRRAYHIRQFIEVVDKKQAIRLELNDLIERGNGVQRAIELPDVAPPPGEGVVVAGYQALLNQQQRERELEKWEADVVECLRRRLPDRVAEFTREVGVAPAGTPYLVHQMRVCIERLVRIKETV